MPTTRTMVLAVTFFALAACRTKPSAEVGPADAGPVQVEDLPVPPAGPFNALPVAAFADAGQVDGMSAFERARAYEATGQRWLARLVLEKEALSPEGAPEEVLLLARLCADQQDAACVEACSKKLGRKLTMDAGTKEPPHSAPEHHEPEGALAQARDLVLKKRYDEARALLEPKVLGGKASKEEVRLLKTACLEQGDRMCVALCNTKLN